MCSHHMVSYKKSAWKDYKLNPFKHEIGIISKPWREGLTACVWYMKTSSSVVINLSIQAAVQNVLPTLPFTQFIMVISQNMEHKILPSCICQGWPSLVEKVVPNWCLREFAAPPVHVPSVPYHVSVPGAACAPTTCSSLQSSSGQSRWNLEPIHSTKQK